MNYTTLIQRVTTSPAPSCSGEWATIGFRPDLGSQQEFIVGVAAVLEGDANLHVVWLPSLSRLGHLYGDALSCTDTRELFNGSERAMRANFGQSLKQLDSGTPHLRIISCGYIASHGPQVELTNLLKRQAGALWHDVQHRDGALDDEWAYNTTMRIMTTMGMTKNPFIAGRTLNIGDKILNIGLDNGRSFGNIVSARYAMFATAHGHIQDSFLEISRAHSLARRPARPAIFVVLPDAAISAGAAIAKKTVEFLTQIEDAGVTQFCHADPREVAMRIQAWTACE